MQYSLKEYNLEETNTSWQYLKENHKVKITYQERMGSSESFWVWVQKIKEEKGEITGIITSNLMNNNFKIGKQITFNKAHIKELSEEASTYDEIMKKIKETKQTQYFDFLRTLSNINIY